MTSTKCPRAIAIGRSRCVRATPSRACRRAGSDRAMIIRVSGGEDGARTVEVARDESVFGKHSTSDVVLPDPKVSRRHARLVVEGGKLFLEDLGSTNGTTLGGRPVTSRVAVSPDDEIAIGPYRIHAELPPRAAQERTEVTPAPKDEATLPPTKKEPVSAKGT